MCDSCSKRSNGAPIGISCEDELTPSSDRSPTEQSFGYARHGSNRFHFIPSPEHIKRECAKIREGWDEATFRDRRARAAP